MLRVRDVLRNLELLEEIACRAGDVDSTGNVTLAILNALDDASGLGALRACCALLCIHDLCAVASFGNLRHCDISLKQMWGLPVPCLLRGCNVRVTLLDP